MKLKNKVAIVTGSGQGIGKGIALALAKEGANVVVSDITEKINDVAKEIEGLGSKALAIKADVSSSEDVKNMAKQTLDKFGKIDILVNNAGIYPFKPLTEMEEKDWDKVLDINLKGIFNCTKAVLTSMIEKKSGNIINIASIAGAVIGYLNLVHYSSSKAGVMGFTRSAALELAQHKIRVNAIAPGIIETPGSKVLGEETLNQFIQMIPLKRMGQPRDIANLVVFLASEESSYITGQCIVTDGGLTIQ
jgi:3-oxoacyl-[acyl-carrier protein] reductase